MGWPAELALSSCSLLVPLAGLPLVRLWERRCRVELDGATRAAAAAAAGLAYLQLGGMLLVFCRCLNPMTAGAWLLGGLALAAIGLPRPLRVPPLSPWLVPGAVVLAVLLLMGTVPPWYQDDMTYHLALPRLFAMAGGYVVPDDNIFTNLPLGWECILSLLCALGRAPDHFPALAPRLLGVWTAAAAALATAGLARSLGASRHGAGLAGLLLLLVPTMMRFAPSAYVESYLLLLVALAMQGAWRAAAGQRGWLLLAALCAGLAASLKFPGLVVVALLALLLALDGLLRSSLNLELRRPLRFVIIAALVGCPFYIRSWIERGNPLFPSAWTLLGGEGWSAWRAWAWGQILSNYGAGRAPGDYLLLPLRIFATRDMFHVFEGSLNPLLGLGLLLAPLAIFRSRDGPTARPLLGVLLFVLGWGLFWAVTTQQMRFLLPAVPGMAAIYAVTLRRSAGRLRPLLLGLSVVAALGWSWRPGLEIWRRQHTGPWLAGTMDRDAVLSALLPDSYAVFPEVEELVPPGGRIWLIWMRGKTYYLRRDYRMDCIFEAWRFEALLDEHERPEDVVAALQRDGITHLLIHHRFFLVGKNAELEPGRTERLRQRFVALADSGLLSPLRRWDYVALYQVAP